MDDAYHYTANVETPLSIDNAETVKWDGEADLVIVGFGGAGAAAALQAREEAASVILVDRFAGGGATAISGGVVYAGGTRYQQEAGYDNSAENMYNYILNEGTPLRPETLRRFCETSNENLEWVSGHGVKFDSTVYEGRIGYPPEGYFLYYTGMEKFRDYARPVPRGHRTVGKGATGKDYFPPLRAAVLKGGVAFHPHSPVRRLVVDASGDVLGVEVQVIPADRVAEHQALYKRVNPYKFANGADAEQAIVECERFERNVPQERRRYRAWRGVILAAGGFTYNLKLLSRYKPLFGRVYHYMVRGGSMGCDGSGIELGLSAGGTVDYMDSFGSSKVISPPEAFVEGVLVNAEGRRFIAEDAYMINVGRAIYEQSHEGVAWLIVDKPTFRRGFKELTTPLSKVFSWFGLPAVLNVLFGGTRKARTLGALAAKIRVDPVALADSVRRYNQDAVGQIDTEHHKLAQHIRPQATAPFYAINLSLKNKIGISGTMAFGGLNVNEDTGNVTRADGRVIPGLYAAGRTAVGVCSKNYFSGLSIADTVFSGRRAARVAMRRPIDR